MEVFLVNFIWFTFFIYLWCRTSDHFVKTTPRGGGPKMSLRDQTKHHFRQYQYYKSKYELEKSERERFESQYNELKKERQDGKR